MHCACASKRPLRADSADRPETKEVEQLVQQTQVDAWQSALQARRSALVEQFAMAAMAKDEEGKTEAREAIQRFNEKNPGRRIQPMQLAQSVRMREKRIREAEDGVYLPKKRRDAMEAGRFAAEE